MTDTTAAALAKVLNTCEAVMAEGRRAVLRGEDPWIVVDRLLRQDPRALAAIAYVSLLHAIDPTGLGPEPRPEERRD